MIVAQGQHAALQLGDGRHQAQAQSCPGRAAAGVAAVEALKDLGFFCIGNARTIVRYGDPDAAVWELAGFDCDFAICLCILESIVDKVGNRFSIS
jgi:hypothetical protein